ncbi:MAG: PKD domain-containing protein [Candidatus Bipolaricaulota bacterium]|nr:PKD domain-containing protein [Candidatus Bipolaricaulota bacterium]MDW8126618.1 PKD domain-containing protein [Candidatus Bipolaricaulota bacterium]
MRKISLAVAVVLGIAVPLFAQGYFEVSQGTTKVAVTPFSGTKTAQEFYDYDSGQSRSRNQLAEPNTAVLFLYREPAGQLYLFFILGKAEAGTAGNARFTIKNIPIGADFTLKDDAFYFPLFAELSDTYTPTNGDYVVYWVWGDARTDGGVFGPLGEEFALTIVPEALSGVQRIAFKYGDINKPTRVELNTLDPIVVKGMRNQPPVAKLVVTPTAPRARQEVLFDASASYDPDGSIVKYQWDFDGDGKVDLTSTEAKVRYTYLTGGNFTVGLTVVDNTGITTSITYPLYVSPVTVRVTREISTTYATPGSVFRVTVTIKTDQDLVGVGLDEDPPANWEVIPIQNAGAVFNRPYVQWVFIDTIRAGTERVIIYDLKVPTAEQLASLRLPQRFCITGLFQSKVPDIALEVEGETCLIVDSCLPILEAVAHLIPPEKPGDQDRLDLRLSEMITVDQVNRAAELWRTGQPVPGTCGEQLDLEKVKLIAAYAYSCTPVDEQLPTYPQANVKARRTILYPIPCEAVVIGFYDSMGNAVGNKFTVKVEIETDRDVIGVGLDEDLPVGWRLTPIQNSGFVYKPGVDQWVLLDVLKPGRPKIIIYEVTVPPSIQVKKPLPGPCPTRDSQTIVGRVDTGLPCQEVDVTGQNKVELSDCLSVLAAIAKWDVNRDVIDLTLSDKITFQQVQRAIAFWLEGSRVPRACDPGVVDFEIMKTVIAYWLTGTPICEPLPGQPPTLCEGR